VDIVVSGEYLHAGEENHARFDEHCADISAGLESELRVSGAVHWRQAAISMVFLSLVAFG
jgi:hypothetical protein